METGAITGYIDVAQLTLYAFWAFFAGLVFYLRREDRREGYPLEAERPRQGRKGNANWLFLPPKKTYRLPDGHTYTTPGGSPARGDVPLRKAEIWDGAPYIPTGDPMIDGVGAAAYAQRRDEPELTQDGLPNIVPLRVDHDHFLDARDGDPRGMDVVTADRRVAGVCSDVWVDRSEPQIRYFEVEVAAGQGGARSVLVPAQLARVHKRYRQITVKSVLARHFATAPTIRSGDQVTKLEEDKICAYFAGGNVYGTPARAEPLI